MVYLHIMDRLTDDIKSFLEGNGFRCSLQMRHGFDVVCTRTADGRQERMIFPLGIRAETPEEALLVSQHAEYAIRMASREEGGYPLIVAEDRWNRQREMMEARLLAHLELFSQAYARNCEVRRIDKAAAREFLDRNHSYGYASCKYRYGLFLKRHTGHIAEEIIANSTEGKGDIGKLIAVATFSNARRWIKDGREIRSYEWTRYASLPDMRISGGMGKLLKAFINETQPDDIMSYADLEWSEGRVYERLGFKREHNGKEGVSFVIDRQSWTRKATKSTGEAENESKPLYFRNFGSRKYRLKLTDYQ